MNNLPMKTTRKNTNIFSKIIDNLKLGKDDEQARENISMFKNHPKFSAYKSEFVKFATHLMHKENPNLCIFFADGDGLRVANELAEKKAEEMNIESAKRIGLSDISQLENPLTGEQLVDSDIESVVCQINSINEKYGYHDALVGIQGDEFFISIPNIKEEDKQKIYHEYSKCSSGLITISVGYCDDMTNGVEDAFNKAEEQAQEIKLKKKQKNRESIFKENNEEILQEELKAMLSQLRIQVDSLTQTQKNLLKNNISMSFEDSLRTPEGIFNDAKALLSSSPSVDFSISKRISTLDSDLENSYSCPISPEQRKNFILSNILTRNPVKSIEKLGYFIQKGANNLISSSKEKTSKNLQNNNLVTIELSGIKDINDTFGHSKCDEMIFETLTTINSLINESGIKLNSPIFSHNISCYGFLISDKNSAKLDELLSKVSSIDSEFKLAASYGKLGQNIDESSLDSILKDPTKSSNDVLDFLITNTYNANREKNNDIISEKKINDKASISRYISRNLKQITKSLGKNLDSESLHNALNYVLDINTPAPLEKDKSIDENLKQTNCELTI